MQVLIVSLLFIGIIFIIIGDTMRNKHMDEIIQRKQMKSQQLNLRDDNLEDEILQQQFSTSKQDQIIDSQFNGPNVSEIFAETFNHGALFSHGFILGTDLIPLHDKKINN